MLAEFGISTRLRRDIYFSLESVEKICRVMNYKVDVIVEFIPDDQAKKERVTAVLTQSILAETTKWKMKFVASVDESGGQVP